ncbi:MAG: alpha/beta hydrolase [Deltaproteobacteria bacterium]|nr:alpha/beta hydrolase [Deltaproteobacteria bacterium]
MIRTILILLGALCACDPPGDGDPAAAPVPPAVPRRDRDVMCPAPDGGIAASLYEPDGPATTAVLVDVGARMWDRWGDLPDGPAFSHYRELAEALQDTGVAVLLYDKRGTGHTLGHPPGTPGRIRDSLAARACLARLVPGARIVRVGHSAGSAVACHAWAPGERLVLLSPVVNPGEMPDAPTLIVRGEADGGRAADDARLAAHPETRWVGVPGANHLLRVEGRVAPEALAAVTAFVTAGSPP